MQVIQQLNVVGDLANPHLC